jgi:hypothetical protein
MATRHPTLAIRWSLYALSAVTAAIIAMPGIGAPPPEASSLLQVELAQFGCDAWGGDGDHTPLVLTLVVGLAIHNPTREPVWIEAVSWQLPPAAGGHAGRWEAEPLPVPPGETVAVHGDRWIEPDESRALEQGVDTVAQRQPEPISGEVMFSDGQRRRTTPYTVSGRWVGCFEPR